MDKVDRLGSRAPSFGDIGFRPKGRLNPLSKEAFFKNPNYAKKRVDLEKLKGLLRLVETANPASRRMKDNENNFLQGLNAELEKINNCAKREFFQIEDEINFYTRKIETLPVTQAELDHVIQDILQLEQYCSVSEKDFLTIMKIHDTIIGVNSRAWFLNRIEQEYFMNVPYIQALYRLSKLFGILRNAQPPPTPRRVKSEALKTPVRQYFIKDADFVRTQAWVLRHCLITVEYEQTGSEYHQFTSVYLDDERFSMCNNFLHKAEGACLLRISWEGEDNHLCRISFKAQSGITEGMVIKYQYVGGFLNGTWDFMEYIQARIKKGKISADEGEKLIEVARPIIELIKHQNLRPCMRVNLSHTTFHDAQAARVGIDFSVEIKKVKKGHSWLGQLSKKPKDHTWLPVSVLKINSKKELDWVKELVAQKIIFRVPAGHAYDHGLYGVTQLYRKRSASLTLPGWLPYLQALVKEQVDEQREIFAPRKRSLGTPLTPTSPFSVSPSLAGTPAASPAALRTHGILRTPQVKDIVQAISSMGGQRRDSVSIQLEDDYREETSDESPLLPREQSPEPPLPPASTRLAPPTPRRKVRVEPKIFFSNERSLFQWINMSVILSAIAMVLIRIGSQPSRWCGYTLMGVSVLFTLYAGMIFHLRLRSLRLKKPTWAYEDNFGPIGVISVVAIALAVCVVFQQYPITPPMHSEISYGMIPGDTPFNAQQIIFSAPIPSEIFLNNRTNGVVEVMSMLVGTGFIHAKDVELDKFTLWELKINELWTNNHTVDQYFNLNLVNEVRSLSCAANPAYCAPEIRFELSSDIPSFRSLTQPTTGPNGTSLFAAQMGCGGSSFYRSCVAPSNDAIHSFNDLQKHIYNVTDALHIRPETPLQPKRVYDVERWASNVWVFGSPARMQLDIYHNSKDHAIFDSSLQFKFDSRSSKGSAFESTRTAMIVVIEQLWGAGACK